MREGDAFRFVALHNAPPALAERRGREPVIRPGPATTLGRMAKSKRAVQVADTTADRAYLERDPDRIAAAELGGYRTVLGVPMLKGQRADRRYQYLPSRVRAVFRQANRAGSKLRRPSCHRYREHAAAQRTAPAHRRSYEALEQQTATSEVLKVISSSPGELEPVFNAMLANATRICEAKFGNLFLCEGPCFQAVAVHSSKATPILGGTIP